MPKISTQKDLKSPGVLGMKPGEIPIGGIIDWYKNQGNTGTVLPDGWVECNGQVLSDSESTYNGNTIPDINGSLDSQQKFRRCATTSNSSAQGNADGVTSVPAVSLSNSTTSVQSGAPTVVISAVNMSNTGAALQSAILPKYFQVVAIMRVK